MSERLQPRDARTLLRDPGLIRWACSSRNPAFHQADATTKDAHGRRIDEYLSDSPDWGAEVRALVCGPFIRFVEALEREPVRLSSPIRRPGRKPRVVGVPTFLRRCISNLLNDALARTCNRRLPASVRAYRKGDAGAVREAILDVAEGVVDGEIIYFAKLDFTNFFPSMPWSLIEQALQHYEFTPEFTEYVMAVVRCRLVRSVHRRVEEVPNDRGAQMGLAESSFLANLVPFEIDEFMQSRRGKLFYIRYSDDLIIGSKFAHEVLGAVRVIQNWCRKHGLRLKGTSPDTHPRKLVHDVRRQRIEFLGAEIDQNGVVHVPADKLAEKIARLEEMSTKRVETTPVREVVFGVSRYGDGDGVDGYDADDIRRSANAFVDYWMSLDLAEASRVDDILKKRFPWLPPPSGDGCGTVWSCQLWADQAVHGEETTNPVHLIQSADPGHPPSTATRTPPQAAGGTAVEEGNRSPLSLHGDEPPHGGEGWNRDPGRRNGPGPWAALHPDGRELDLAEEAQEDHTDAGADVLEDSDLYTNGWEATGSCLMDSSPSDSMISCDHRFDSPSEENDDLKEREEEDPLDQDDPLDLLGAVGDAADEESFVGLGDESPVPPRFEKGPVVHVAAAPVRMAAPCCLVASGTSNAGLVGRARLRTLRHCNPETAVVLTITALVREARVRGQSALHVALQNPWLAKLLLQPRRRFRSPQLLRRVLRLHEDVRQSGVRVVITGGRKTPPSVLRRLDGALVEIAREHARSAHWSLGAKIEKRPASPGHPERPV